ncbi:hypothetical protein GN956_G18427 [Arapaima gigas]
MNQPLRWEELPGRVENAVGRVDYMEGYKGDKFQRGAVGDVVNINDKRWTKNWRKVSDKCYNPPRLAFLPAGYDLLLEDEAHKRREEKKQERKERNKCMKVGMKLGKAACLGLSSLMAGLQTVHAPPIPSATSLVFNFNSPKASG